MHQGILLVFQDDPRLAFDLLGVVRPVTGLPIDRRAEVEREGPEPLSVRPGFPDLVMVHRDPKDERVGIVITVEAQAKPDYSKRYMIPVYQSHLAEEHELDTYVVVVSLSRPVSRLIRRWSVGGPPRLDVLLHDIDTIPRSPWLDDPASRPLAAVLLGALRGYAGDFEAARIGFHAARELKRRRQRHGMTVLAALPEPQREQLIGELPMQEQHEWIEVERRSGTYQVGRREGREEGARVLRELLLGCLDQRGFTLDDASAQRIHACEDLETLQRWARRAMTVGTLEQLFESG